MSRNLNISKIIDNICKINKKIVSVKYKNTQLSTLYFQLGNLYKINKEYSKAANSYINSADYYRLLGDIYTYNENLYLAGDVLKYIDPKKSIELFEKVCRFYLKNNHLTKAANIKLNISNIYETLHDNDNVITNLKTAIEYYKLEKSISNVIKCNLKIINVYITQNNFRQSIEILDNIIKLSKSNNLLEYNINKYLFYKILCVLSLQDLIEAKRLLDDYKNNYSFSTSKDYKFLESLLNIINECDIDKFINLVSEYNNLISTNKIIICLLLKNKDNIEQI